MRQLHSWGGSGAERTEPARRDVYGLTFSSELFS
jgi:hypothetical protein